MQDAERDLLKRHNRTGEYLYRNEADSRLQVAAPQQQVRPRYPWEEAYLGNIPKITRDFFRCRGSHAHAAYTTIEADGSKTRVADCGGRSHHSLPLREQKEFVYPILIDLLNYIQARSEKRVVITSGHRCPQHNQYVDASAVNRTSKHLLGAEVDFYVEGLEQQPEIVLQWVMEYYQIVPFYKDKKEYQTFERPPQNEATAHAPHANKEIFIKIFQAQEGRNFDNQHPYPYLAIQVRYDREKQQRVIYSWDQAVRNYMRW